MNRRLKCYLGIQALFMILLFSGCAHNEKEISTLQDEMPSIVFLLERTKYPIQNGVISYQIFFYDNEGRYCSSHDQNVCKLSFDKLIEEYEQGNLTESIEYTSSCDIDDLKDNYRKLCEIGENPEYQLEEFDAVSSVVTDKVIWYGFYYDDAGNIQSIQIYKLDEGGRHYPNDDRANEIYDWIQESFHKGTT